MRSSARLCIGLLLSLVSFVYYLYLPSHDHVKLDLVSLCVVRTLPKLCHPECPIWLDFGPLLTLVRNNTLSYPNERDIDMAIFRRDYETIVNVLPALDKECGTLSVHRNTPNSVPFDTWRSVRRSAIRIFVDTVWKTNVYIDIADYEIVNQGHQNVVQDLHFINDFSPTFPINVVLPLVQCVENLPYSCPNDREKYLEIQFGKNWRTPKRGCHGSSCLE
eukprot:PhF_6_TR14470/c0_g1_i1/m.23037